MCCGQEKIYKEIFDFPSIIRKGIILRVCCFGLNKQSLFEDS